MIFMETNRLHLRNVVVKDAEIMYDYRNNEICARYQRGQVKDYDGIVNLVECHKDDVLSVDAPFLVAVALKDTDEMVGEIVVMPSDGTISIGYTFSYKHHRRGYAFEALTALIDLLHERYSEWDFISFTEPQNEPSMALLKKLGWLYSVYGIQSIWQMDNSGNRSRNCSSDKFNEINQKSQNAVNKKFKIENEIKI